MIAQPRESANSIGLFRGWGRFWLTPVDPVGLSVTRVLACLLFLGWLLPLAGQVDALFGPSGWFDARAFHETARLEDGPPAPLSWSLLYLCGANPVVLHCFFWASVGVVVLFALGLWTRVTSVLTWLAVASFIASPAAGFEADYLLILLAFYLMVGHLLLGQWSRPLTPFERILGSRRGRQPSVAANLTLRLIQVHFAIVLLVSGLHKLQFGDWWAGVAWWYPLNPPLEMTPEKFRARAANADGYLAFLSLAQYAALAWQLTFPLFAWRRRWRGLLLLGGAAGWVGSLVIYRQPLFGPILFVACVSFVSAEEWRRLRALASRLFSSRSPRKQGEPAHV